MQSAEVQGLDFKVLLKVDTLAIRVWVAAVAAAETEALVSQSDHVVGIELLDILAG